MSLTKMIIVYKKKKDMFYVLCRISVNNGHLVIFVSVMFTGKFYILKKYARADLSYWFKSEGLFA